MRWHDVAVGSDLKQLFPAFWIALFFCQFPGVCSVAFSKNHNSITGNLHAFQLVLLIQGFWIMEVIQPVNRLLDVLLVVQKSFFIYFHRSYRMPWSPLLHKFSKKPSLIGLLPLRRHLPEYLIPDASLIPVWDHYPLLNLKVLFLYFKTDKFPVVHYMHIFHGMAA